MSWRPPSERHSYGHLGWRASLSTSTWIGGSPGSCDSHCGFTTGTALMVTSSQVTPRNRSSRRFPPLPRLHDNAQLTPPRWSAHHGKEALLALYPPSLSMRSVPEGACEQAYGRGSNFLPPLSTCSCALRSGDPLRSQRRFRSLHWRGMPSPRVAQRLQSLVLISINDTTAWLPHLDRRTEL
jgi:hypothetical protein